MKRTFFREDRKKGVLKGFKMKKSVKKESLEKRYFRRLMRDKSLEDKMRVFTEAKIIFSCGVGRMRGE